MKGIERERVELVARMYATNEEAARALGVVLRSFSRMCGRYGIETPYARRRRRRREAVRCQQPETACQQSECSQQEDI